MSKLNLKLSKSYKAYRNSVNDGVTDPNVLLKRQMYWNECKARTRLKNTAKEEV